MPMTLYGPEKTRQWSTRELAALLDKDVSVSFRPDGSSATVGRVADAGVGRFGQVWIQFEGGASVTWDRDSMSATIIVEG